MRNANLLLLIFYCLRSDGAYIKYEGMEQKVIDSMLIQQKQTCTYIDESTYEVSISSISHIL